ncbi:MAG: COX15/CtaA family protein [candidate division Zixibacteria bacterium]|nr:COX15/CtaA family protein [candidate division Zixibacteria bacterium]
MKAFRNFAFISTVTSYLLIFTGGLVRVSGAGLGCPDWTKCFGRWWQPLSLSQLPTDVDPSTFNFALAWIEYLNRLFGMLLGLLVVVTAILAIIHYRRVLRILLPTLVAALFVAFAGWQGGKVVTSHLEPLLVSFHLIVALAVVKLLTYVTPQASYLDKGMMARSGGKDKTHVWIAILWLVTIIQILLGTHVRASLEKLAITFPLDNDLALIAKSGGAKYIHMIFGILTAIMTFQVAYQVLRLGGRALPLMRVAVWSVMSLMVVQLLLGTGLLVIGIPPLLQVFHLWVAALLIGTILYLYSAVRVEVQSS